MQLTPPTFPYLAWPHLIWITEATWTGVVAEEVTQSDVVIENARQTLPTVGYVVVNSILVAGL